jgi:hypothetical protein
MTYRGLIKNGVAVLNAEVALPDGTPVRVEVESDNRDFLRGKSVDELAREQGVQPRSAAGDLTIDWPTEESIDDLLALVREVRR